MVAAVEVMRRGSGFGYIVRTEPVGIRGDFEASGMGSCARVAGDVQDQMCLSPVSLYVSMCTCDYISLSTQLP